MTTYDFTLDPRRTVTEQLYRISRAAEELQNFADALRENRAERDDDDNENEPLTLKEVAALTDLAGFVSGSTVALTGVALGVDVTITRGESKL